MTTRRRDGEYRLNEYDAETVNGLALQLLSAFAVDPGGFRIADFAESIPLIRAIAPTEQERADLLDAVYEACGRASIIMIGMVPVSEPKTLGPDDEPRETGAVVAVNYGDYRSQEIWINSGSSIGNWIYLGGEYGRPRVWVDPRSELEKMGMRGNKPVPHPGPGEIPQYPVWDDVLARGPVTLLTPGDQATYGTGWRNGRRRMVQQMEEVADDE